MLIAYENEAIAAQQKGEKVDYVVPDADDPDREPGRGHEEREASKAKDFVNFLYTPQAQKIFAVEGLPARVKAHARGATSSRRRSSSSRSRSSAAGRRSSTKFFDPDNSVMAAIEKGLGVSTSK